MWYWIWLKALGMGIILFWIKNLINIKIQAVGLLMGISKNKVVFIYSIIFLPGVLLHELSHFLIAAMLGVKTGEITLFPHEIGSSRESHIALGSVRIRQTDFFRAVLIGIAPIIFGSISLYFGARLLTEGLTTFDGKMVSLTDLQAWWQLKHGLLVYFLWAIANTIFPSREDVKALPVMAVVVGLGIVVVRVSGQMWQRLSFLDTKLELVGRALVLAYLVALLLNLTTIVILSLLQLSLQRLRRKKVVYGRKD